MALDRIEITETEEHGAAVKPERVVVLAFLALSLGAQVGALLAALLLRPLGPDRGPLAAMAAGLAAFCGALLYDKILDRRGGNQRCV